MKKVVDHELRPFCTLCLSFSLIALVSREVKQPQFLVSVAMKCLVGRKDV